MQNAAHDGIKTYNIFVGDLLPQVGENDLRNAFTSCGPIHSVLVMRDKTTGMTKGYGFVHFKVKEAQQKALRPPFNTQAILGRPCRVNPSDDKNTLFVGNLAPEMNEQQVRVEIESLVGPVMHIELKTGPPPTFTSRGFAFVTFNDRDTADNAKRILQQKVIRGKPLNVKWADPCREVDAETMSKVKTLYVSNINLCVRPEQLQGYYSQFGTVKNCVIVKNNQTGQSKGFAFVEFQDRADCEQAMKYTKNHEFCGQPLNVVLAKPPPDDGPGVFGNPNNQYMKNYNKFQMQTMPGMRGRGGRGFQRGARRGVTGGRGGPGFNFGAGDGGWNGGQGYSQGGYNGGAGGYGQGNSFNQGYGGPSQFGQGSYGQGSYGGPQNFYGQPSYGGPQGQYSGSGSYSAQGGYSGQNYTPPASNVSQPQTPQAPQQQYPGYTAQAGYNPHGGYNQQGGYGQMPYTQTPAAGGYNPQSAAASYQHQSYQQPGTTQAASGPGAPFASSAYQQGPQQY